MNGILGSLLRVSLGVGALLLLNNLFERGKLSITWILILAYSAGAILYSILGPSK